MPIETKITKWFANNLKRNAGEFSLFRPKYASRRNKFINTYDMLDDSEKPFIRSFFMYNKPSGKTSGLGGVPGIGGYPGLACVLYDIYSKEKNNSIDNLYDYPTNPKLFIKRTQTTCIDDDLKSIADYSGYGMFYLNFYLLIT